ncbi:MAG: family N-acetyltransferase [Herminiimonas sp.]|nr:family N-acetyltransferase [Herminiimonas sp.]
MSRADTRLEKIDRTNLTGRHEPTCSDSDGAAAISVYEGEIPLFVGAELDRLYGNLFSSLVYLRVYNRLAPGTCTYVARSGGEIVSIFLYCRKGNAVRVLNEGMRLSGEDTSRFATAIFARYPEVEMIFLRALNFGTGTDDFRLQFPVQKSGCPGDVIADLPQLADDYLTSLGKNTRKNIRRNERRIKEFFPSFDVNFHDGATASEAHIRRIIDLNRVRMADTGNAYRRSEAEVQGLLALTRAYGLVGVATIEAQVCGGTIGLKIGDTCTGRIIAHDPRYNNFGLGLVCAYHATREAIVRGSRRFNFMAGNNEFKNMLGGRVQEQGNRVIYRSRLSVFRHPTVGLAMVGHRLAFRAISAMQEKIRELEREEAQQRSGMKSRTALYSLKAIRRIKQTVSSSPGEKD